MSQPSNTLVHVLIGKSILEALLVGGLALLGFLNLAPPFFHGWGEVTEKGIEGWAVNSAKPWDRVEVELYIDGRYAGRSIANLSRPDVQTAGWSRDEWHGYRFQLTSVGPGAHEARVYALHHGGDGVRKSLQLLGDPIGFRFDENGSLSGLPK